MVWPTVAEVLSQMRRQQRQAVWPEGRSRNWYSVMVLSEGSFQLSAMDRSPPTPASPAGAPGADAGADAPANVVAATSPAAPAPPALAARIWNR